MTIPVDPNWTQSHYVKLLLDENIMNMIVTETNRYGDQYRQKRYPREETREKRDWIPVTVDKMWTFFGMFIYQAVTVKPKKRWFFKQWKI